MRSSLAACVLASLACACGGGSSDDEIGETGEAAGTDSSTTAPSESEGEASGDSTTTGDSTRGDSTTSDSTSGDSTTSDSTTGDSGDSSTGDSTTGDECQGLESNLPLILIDAGGQPILDDPKIDADMLVIDNGEGALNCVSDSPAFAGPIGIETRGSTSQMYPKKSYGIETRDEFGDDLDVSILGMPAESDWVLYGPYPDKTLLRDALTYHLHTQMGHYSSRTRHVEVLLDGEYRGVYVWMERIQQDAGRVAISDIDEGDVAGDALTGGYILKVDKLTGDVGSSWVSPYSSEVTLQVHDPKDSKIVPAQAEYIQAKVTQFEHVLAGPDFADPLLGYPTWIDVDSYIDFMILQELGRTVDGYRSSSFFYKDRDSVDGRFVAGPMWDFNLSYGNADYCEAFSTSGYQYEFDSVCGDFFTVEIPFWWQRLLEDPKFADALRCRWESLREGVLSDEAIAAWVEAEALELADAQARNFERWPILGVYVAWNPYVGATYADEIDYLLKWISDRAAWLDENLGGAC
ncbi:CotH kinase family protein [Nannocystaceae bacterium ST9]